MIVATSVAVDAPEHADATAHGGRAERGDLHEHRVAVSGAVVVVR